MYLQFINGTLFEIALKEEDYQRCPFRAKVWNLNALYNGTVLIENA
jgi:hypothetical protein